MWISRYVCLFMIYSLMGWIYESVYCTIRKRKWENRGFLYGPICPIYGVGAIMISAVAYFFDRSGLALTPWHIYFISVVGSAFLEYITSWTLEKIFHAIWWDYSHLPLNIHGRVSLFTSLGFGAGGLLIVYVIIPLTATAMKCVSPILTEFWALFLLFIFAVDFTLTVVALLHFDRIVTQAESNFNQNMATFVDGAIQQTQRITHGVTAKKVMMKGYANSLSGLVRKTIFRVYLFKDKDKQKETLSNNLRFALRKTNEVDTDNFREG